MAAADVGVPPLLVDGDGRPLGWLDARRVSEGRVGGQPRTKVEPIVDIQDVLRDALAELLEAETQYAPVVDPGGRVVGVLSIEIIAETLQQDPEGVATGADSALAQT
jgi:CBS domain containing-hemolysin-like protein